MRLYYAHSMYIYNTEQENRDLALIARLGFSVLNPNTKEIQIAFQSWVESHRMELEYEKEGVLGYEDFSVMTFFTNLIIEGYTGNSPYGRIEGVIFRAAPGGAIPGGVAKEVDAARKIEIPVIELPSFAGRQMLDKDETRQLLKELGQR